MRNKNLLLTPAQTIQVTKINPHKLCTHTNRAAGMGAHEVDLGLGDGTHADLVKSTGEEGGEGTTEHYVPVPAGQPDTNTTDVLLGNEALDIAVGESFLVCEGEGGVLGVPIEGNDTLVVLSQLHQSISIHFTSGNLSQEE